jgi:hypothetical protein
MFQYIYVGLLHEISSWGRSEQFCFYMRVQKLYLKIILARDM